MLVSGCTLLPTKEELSDPDGDGSPYGDDCDNGDASVFPGAPEVWYDGIDNDCDPATADDDADGDGYASEVTGGADCDDGDANANPAATELCDGVDDDCDGTTDEGDAEDASIWYADADDDGYGDDASATQACQQPAGYVATGGDCDDSSADYHPGADEGSCTDPEDYDCDGRVTDVDLDHDGFSACVDCDDGNASVNPDALEICDDQDNDCDGLIDDADSSLHGGTTYYLDEDSDGFGSLTASTMACSTPDGFSAVSGDCDDSDASVNPAESEVCDALDDDCSGDIDDGDVCPCEVDWYDDEAYMFCTDRTAWADAQTGCASYGYQLASINDSDEQDWLNDTAYLVRSSRTWWIGYTDAASEGTWAWEDGSSSTWSNWASGEPNDAGSAQDCALMWPMYDGEWYDYYCTYDTLYYSAEYGIGYICESG